MKNKVPMKMIRKILYILTLLAMVAGSQAHAQDRLDSYLVEAAENNPGLKGEFSEYMAALQKVPQVGALPDPQITFGYFIQPVETKLGPQRARISVSQMFPWFGTLGTREDAATEMARSKYEQFREAKSRLFYDVKSTYYNLYFTQKAIKITNENLTILNTFYKVSLIKVEAGMASSVDVLRVEMEIADMENQLILFGDNLNAQRIQFNNLLNVDDFRTVLLPDTLANADIDMTEEAVIDSIRNGNHQVLQMEFMQAAYDKQQIAAQKAGNPGIMVGFDYFLIGKGSNPTMADAGKDAVVFPMIGMTIPIYRKKYTAMVKEAALMQESTENKKLNKINVLETTFEKANNDYRDAGRRIPLFLGQSDKAQKALNILRTEYETAGKNFEEVLRMERQLLKYRLELEKARADKDAAIAFIDYLAGK
jgi:cobalt-zinc-cadmium efflux system outer membrane protein